MSLRTKNMTSGNPATLMLSFALPLMMGNMFQQLYTVVDTAVVGKALGVDALAAVGASDWLNWMFLAMVQGISQGFSILMAQSFGAEQYVRLRKVIGNSVILSAFSAIVLVAAGQLLATPILELLRTPAEILPHTLQYLRIMIYGLPIVMSYNLLASILRALGDGSTPLYAMIVAAITNIVLDLLFVLVFHWGIPGAAIATVIAQGVSSLYCFLHIRKLELLCLSKKDLMPEGKLCRRLMTLGAPLAFQNCIIAIGGMIIQMVVNGFGVVFIAGFTATNKLYGLLEMAATSYGYATSTYVGQNLGAGKITRIRKGVRSANGIAFVTSAVIAAVMLVLGKAILGLFLSGTPEEVLAAMEIGYEYLTIMSICLPILYYLHVTRSALQGMGKTVTPMVSGIFEFLMRTGGVLILPLVLGQTGVFIAEVSAWFGADLVLAVGYMICIRRIQTQYSEE